MGCLSKAQGERGLYKGEPLTLLEGLERGLRPKRDHVLILTVGGKALNAGGRCTPPHQRNNGRCGKIYAGQP